MKPRGLWHNPDFRKLWLGRTISNMGNGITGIALPLTAVLALAATPTIIREKKTSLIVVS